MNIRNSFAILSYLFRVSTNKLSYDKFRKELRKNYDVYKYLFVNKMALVCIPNTKVSKNRLLLHDLCDDGLYRMTRFPWWTGNELLSTRVTNTLRKVYETIRNFFISAFYEVLSIWPQAPNSRTHCLKTSGIWTVLQTFSDWQWYVCVLLRACGTVCRAVSWLATLLPPYVACWQGWGGVWEPAEEAERRAGRAECWTTETANDAAASGQTTGVAVGGYQRCNTGIPYLTFGVGRLLQLPSAEAVSVRPNAQPRCNHKVTVIGCEAETSAVKPKNHQPLRTGDV